MGLLGEWTCDVDEHCYIVIGPHSYHESKSMCKTLAYFGYLAEVTTEEEYSVVEDFLSGENSGLFF